MQEKKKTHTRDKVTGMTYTDLIRVGMRYWKDAETQAYISWVVRNHGKEYFTAGMFAGSILTLFLLCLVAILLPQ